MFHGPMRVVPTMENEVAGTPVSLCVYWIRMSLRSHTLKKCWTDKNELLFAQMNVDFISTQSDKPHIPFQRPISCYLDITSWQKASRSFGNEWEPASSPFPLRGLCSELW